MPVGYFEGFPRTMKNGYVLIHGQQAPVIGRVCMNMTIVDVTRINVQVGDQVTLIGVDGDQELTADDIAGWSGTIQYEVLTRLHPDIRRNIIN